MSTSIYMIELMRVGINLTKFGGNMLPGNIRVEMYGSKMIIKENEIKVFTMKKIKVVGDALLVDYPKTEKGQDGRGWGILAMLIALYYGQSKKCTKVDLGSMIEHTTASLGFWTKFGISKMNGTPLNFAFDKGIRWVLEHCPQRDRKITDFVLR